MQSKLNTNINFISLLFYILIAIIHVSAQENGEWEILNEGGSFGFIDFVDQNTGWIAGDKTLLKTENGGTTWHKLPFEEFEKVRDEGTVCALGNEAKIKQSSSCFKNLVKVLAFMAPR